MHILSKLCLGLTIVLAIIGLILAKSLAEKRNAIAATVVAEKNKRDKNINDLASAKLTRQKEVEELNRLMADWGRQWVAKGATDPQNAQILVNVGLQQGLGEDAKAKRPNAVVYVFSVQPDGSSMYLGEFTAEPVANGQRTALTLNGPRYVQELQKWPAEGEFRVRERIPAGQRATFQDLANNQTVADQIIINETAKLKIQDNHIASSQKTLDGRMAELNGDPAAPQTADPEVVKGLVETIRVEEASRNAVLKDVDTLRRQLSDSYAKLKSVLAENSQAVESMTTGTETAARPAPAAAN
ncbi:MAG TPA: hypothetical protein VM510_10505 [Caulifigura sp.]|nr:hypothetical protein [Caulifigura sp.]